MVLKTLFTALGLFLISLGIHNESLIDLLLGSTFFIFSAYDLYRRIKKRN